MWSFFIFLNFFISWRLVILQYCSGFCHTLTWIRDGLYLFSVLLDWLSTVLQRMALGTVKVKLLSSVWLFATPWTVACQASPSMGFSPQAYWSGLPFPSPRDLPYPGVEPKSPALKAGSLLSEPLCQAYTTWASVSLSEIIIIINMKGLSEMIT